MIYNNFAKQILKDITIAPHPVINQEKLNELFDKENSGVIDEVKKPTTHDRILALENAIADLAIRVIGGSFDA